MYLLSKLNCKRIHLLDLVDSLKNIEFYVDDTNLQALLKMLSHPIFIHMRQSDTTLHVLHIIFHDDCRRIHEYNVLSLKVRYAKIPYWSLPCNAMLIDDSS